MSDIDRQPVQGAIVEEDIHLTLVELCQACHAPEEYVIAWVFEGVLEPVGAAPPDWRFTGPSLRRAQLAGWLARDLEVNPPGVALALDLLDEIAALRARLRRFGAR
ncbi:MAG: MerR family transcriptional regulator [Thiobacillus sp.]|nr:MerR family transcriptional regulator [Thiobacillus sp.]